MNDVTKVLTEARELISEPGQWTKKFYARDALGGPVEWENPMAVSWCSAGAIGKAAGISQELQNRSLERQTLFRHALGELHRVAGDRGLAVFNDNHTHAEVLEIFDKVIEGRKA